MKKEYSNGEVTVSWEPDKCIHSKMCWQGLLQVFNPQNRPWVNMDGASSNRIIEQVQKCPSGALNFYMSDEKQSVSDKRDDFPTFTLMKNGPILVKGDFSIQNSDGSEEKCVGSTALCRCGASQRKPYCDGSHKSVSFEG